MFKACIYIHTYIYNMILVDCIVRRWALQPSTTDAQAISGHIAILNDSLADQGFIYFLKGGLFSGFSKGLSR